MRKNVILSSFLAVAIVVMGCGSSGTGEPGAPGADGAPGAAGAPGSTGTPGAPGADGTPGTDGDQGEQGATGHVGDMICGDTLIRAEEWHSVCGSNVGSCRQGQVQCRLRSVDSELVPYRTCFGEVAAAQNSGRCDTDADCDGNLDDTTGTGDNVTLVKQSKQVEVFVSGSSTSKDFTLVSGVCRNAKKHCLLPDGDVCRADQNGVGVLWSDFVADPREEDMGFECVDGQSVRTWECTVTKGVASVTCTGPRGL